MSDSQTISISRATTIACTNHRNDPEFFGSSSYSDYGTFGPKPVLVSELDEHCPIFTAPFISPLVFENAASDARDHCANERNFLSWLRLSIYLAIIAMAIVLSFQLRTPASAHERRLALPLGLIFWIMAVLCLFTGLGNYLKTVERYRVKRALVQSGYKTQIIIAIVSFTIIATCVFFIAQPH
ncbi:hypothetical protein EV426DRAFT_596264 [Tirmania nivea]|nr:hypothetical protein EV426DRAFT_596264 [Tirmania nivea]